MLKMGPEIPACLSPPLSRQGLVFSVHRDVLPAPPQPVVPLGRPHPHPCHTDPVNTRSYFTFWKTPGTSARAPCLASPTRGQRRARNKPKIGDTFQTESPGPDAGDMGQPKANSPPRYAQITPVVSLAPAGLCRAHGQHWRGVAGPGKPSGQRVPLRAGRVQAGLAAAIPAWRGR